MEEGSVGAVGARRALHAAYVRVGSYFGGVASGAAWLSGASKEVVAAMRKRLGGGACAGGEVGGQGF